MKYILKGCFSSKGFEKIKDGDDVPVGWFEDSAIEKMIKKGTIIVIQNEEVQKEINFEVQDNEMIGNLVIQEEEDELVLKEEIFENKKKGIRKK